MGFNRYAFLESLGVIKNPPKIKLNSRTTDKFIMFSIQSTRLDRISFSIYGDDTYGWLILLANPEYFMEFDIPNNTVIRVPFPLNDALREYQEKIVQNKDK